MKGDANFNVVQVGEENYVQEWQLPIVRLVKTAAFNGADFRFEVLIANNIDGSGRTGITYWNSTVGDQFKTNTNQGLVHLESPLTAIESLPKASSDVLFSNKTLRVSNFFGTLNAFDIMGNLILSVNVQGSKDINLSGLKRGLLIIKTDKTDKLFIP
jgi:hypothetical protein